MAKREDWIKGKKRNYENDISSIIGSVIKPALDKFSKVEADLILNWNKIFGEEYGSKMLFKKVSFVNKKENKFNLTVAVKAKDMLEITYSSDVLLEKLNIYLGYEGAQKLLTQKQH